MNRLVPIFDQRRKIAGQIRLGEVPSLFSEGPEPRIQFRRGIPALTAVRAHIGRFLQQSQR